METLLEYYSNMTILFLVFISIFGFVNIGIKTHSDRIFILFFRSLEIKHKSILTLKF